MKKPRVTLANMELLIGQHEDIRLTEFRAQIGDVIAQVEQGKTFRIMRQGKIVAIIAKPEADAIELGAAVRRLGVAGK